MPHDTAYAARLQQDAPARCSASEQPEAQAHSNAKLKQLMADSLGAIQQQGLSVIDARQTAVGDLAVESFQCQLWEPARAVQELQPGIALVPFACIVMHIAYHLAHSCPMWHKVQCSGQAQLHCALLCCQSLLLFLSILQACEPLSDQ